MKNSLIKSEEDYQRALKRLEAIFDAPVGTPKSDEADILAQIIDEYEHRNFLIEAPDSGADYSTN